MQRNETPWKSWLRVGVLVIAILVSGLLSPAGAHGSDQKEPTPNQQARPQPVERPLDQGAEAPEGDTEDEAGGIAQTTEEEGEECTIQSCDSRDRISAQVLTGIAVDNFAAGELQNVLNPEDANESRDRFVAGFDVEYRLHKKAQERQLWAAVQIIHGVRSSEVDCGEIVPAENGEDDNGDRNEESENNGEGGNGDGALSPTAPAVCALGGAVDPASLNVGDTATYILREATSLEGWASLRYEFLRLKKNNIVDDGPCAVLYLKGRLGFLSVEDSDDDVIDDHKIAIGAMITEERFKGSFLELGIGRTQLYGRKSNGRFKAQALLKWKWGAANASGDKVAAAFAGIVVDSDFGSGSDSVVSLFGLSFDIEKLMGG